jgi:hypothetical protein
MAALSHGFHDRVGGPTDRGEIGPKKKKRVCGDGEEAEKEGRQGKQHKGQKDEEDTAQNSRPNK